MNTDKLDPTPERVKQDLDALEKMIADEEYWAEWQREHPVKPVEQPSKLRRNLDRWGAWFGWALLIGSIVYLVVNE
jgi:hypothetical protein